MLLEDSQKVFNNLYGSAGFSLDIAKKLGDFKDLSEILSKNPQEIIEEIKLSGLKGRGGAGFPTGLKWSFLKKDPNKPSYLVINGDEGEPGTCKDRELIRHEAYKIIEGCIIGAYALGIKTCYVYIRLEFLQEGTKLQTAIDECYKEGLLGENCLGGLYSLDMYIHYGAGAYICGEESALLESLEGKKGLPRLKPPFPAVAGLYGCPTIINNIETIATVPTILRRGASWYNKLGKENSAGTKLFCISGHVNNPCVVEEKLGISLKDLIEKYAGGVKGGWDNLGSVIPGGSSSPILPAYVCQKVTMDFDCLKTLGSSLGTGAVMVFDKNTNILDIMYNIISFYAYESCGQCTPCREGSSSLVKILDKVRKKEASEKDIELLSYIIENTTGTSICALHDATVFATRGFLRYYKDDIRSYIQ